MKAFVKFISSLLLSAIFLVLLSPLAYAGSLTSVSHTPTSGTVSTAYNHTYYFTTATQASVGDYFSVVMVGSSIPADLDYTDVDVTILGAEQTVVLTAADDSLGFTRDSETAFSIHLSGNHSLPPAAGTEIVIEVGTHATYDQTGDRQITVPSTAGEKSIMMAHKQSNDTVRDSGTATMTVNAAAAAPEFSTYMWILVIMAGAYMAFNVSKKQGLRA